MGNQRLAAMRKHCHGHGIATPVARREMRIS